MTKWCKMVALAEGAAEILVFDEIGATEDGRGLSAGQFDADLKALGPVTAITLRINSPGGDVYDGVAIYNTLKNHPAEITARIDGVAASAASLIAMAADRIEMPANAFFLVHEPRVAVAVGTAADLTKAATDLQVMNEAFVSAYVERTGQEADAIRALMAEDRLMSAAEALSLGFADEITEAVKMTASYGLKKLPEKARAVVAAALKGPKMNRRTRRASASRARAEDGDSLEDLKKQAKALAKKIADMEGDEGESDGDGDGDEPAPKGKARASDDDGQSDADTTARARASDDDDGAEDEEEQEGDGEDQEGEEEPPKAAKGKGKAKARAPRTFARGHDDAIAYAQQVTETCNLAGHPERAAAYLRDRKPLADVRSDLMKAQASAHTGIASRHGYGGARGVTSPAAAAEDAKGWDKAIAKVTPVGRAKARGN